MGLGGILALTMIPKVTIRNVLLICILILLGAVSFTVWRNFKTSTPEQLVEMLPDNVDVALDNIDYTETRGDQRFWRLQADSVSHEAQQKEVSLQNVRMTVYDQGELGDIELTGQSGKWFSETGNIELTGDVVAKSDQGLALYCQELFYDNKAEMITSESLVRIVAKDMETTGRGLKVFLPEQRIVILSQVKTELSNW
ncbi:LPS export ABC transporter periplasmic protein LptC [Syntrophotalea acetylenivorans]|uniref:LPS export ABC transporter periplasmic protein LptC n=2 Tax=Syntrophotalea acetylenivorans TaxID=1842532 RepID=A0A1L3GKY3_9BACT|nr:LPS export ABC transporter periplasmic protein LptC [Syntrophotalea acetylenivorans]